MNILLPVSIVLLALPGVHGCSGKMKKNVFLKSKKLDFNILYHPNLKLSQAKTVPVSKIVSGRKGSFQMKRLDHLEITAKTSKPLFIVQDFTFDVTVKKAPAKINVIFSKGSDISSQKMATVSISSKKKKVVQLKPSFIESLPLIDRIQIFSPDTNFNIGSIFLDACSDIAKRPQRKKKPRKTTSVTSPASETVSPLSVQKPWKKPERTYDMPECCPKALFDDLSTTTMRPTVTEFSTPARPPGQEMSPKEFLVTFVIDTGLYSEEGVETIANTLVKIIEILLVAANQRAKDLRMDVKKKPLIKVGIITFSKKSTMVISEILTGSVSKVEIQQLLQNLEIIKFKKDDVNFISGVETADNILKNSHGGFGEHVLRFGFFMTSYHHQGCHNDLLEAVTSMKESTEFVYAIGVGTKTIEDELRMITDTMDPRFSGFEQVSDLTKITKLKDKFQKLFKGYVVQDLGPNIGLYKLRSGDLQKTICPFASPDRSLPKVIQKEKRSTIWKATAELFDQIIETCDYSFDFEKDIKHEAGGNAVFPRKEMSRFQNTFELFSKYVLEGKFIMINKSPKAMAEWLGEKSGLSKHYAKVTTAFDNFQQVVVRMAGEHKKACMTKVFESSIVQKRITEFNGKIKQLRKML